MFLRHLQGATLAALVVSSVVCAATIDVPPAAYQLGLAYHSNSGTTITSSPNVPGSYSILGASGILDPAIDAWMNEHAGELGAIAHHWFEVMRKCEDEVRELLHDGCPVACLGEAPFGYVNVFTSHVNVGFFHGAALPDPDRLLQGTGKFMRHVKLRPGTATNATALSRLIDMAYSDIKARVENG